MGWFERKSVVQIDAISGVVRVEVRTGINWLSVIVEIAFLGFILRAIASSWLKLSLFNRVYVGWVTAGGVVGIFHLLKHSEVIEFDHEHLNVRRTVLGWERTSTYRVDSCSELTWRVQEGSDHFALECKVGVRTIRFGQYLSEAQAQEVLALLQKSLPDVAQHMGMSPADRASHITRLGLS